MADRLADHTDPLYEREIREVFAGLSVAETAALAATVGYRNTAGLSRRSVVDAVCLMVKIVKQGQSRAAECGL